MGMTSPGQMSRISVYRSVTRPLLKNSTQSVLQQGCHDNVHVTRPCCHGTHLASTAQTKFVNTKFFVVAFVEILQMKPPNELFAGKGFYYP